MKLVKISIRTTQEQKQRLREIAERRGTSVSGVLRLILEQAVDESWAGGPVVQ